MKTDTTTRTKLAQGGEISAKSWSGTEERSKPSKTPCTLVNFLSGK